MARKQIRRSNDADNLLELVPTSDYRDPSVPKPSRKKRPASHRVQYRGGYSTGIDHSQTVRVEKGDRVPLQKPVGQKGAGGFPNRKSVSKREYKKR